MMNPLENCRAVIFDLYYTLALLEPFDSEGLNESIILGIERERWLAVCRECYADGALGIIKSRVQFMRNIVRRIIPDASEDLIQTALECRLRRYTKSLVDIDPLIIKTLESMRRMNLKIGLISNADIVDKAGWNDSPLRKYFDVSLFSCDLGLMKPDRRIYDLAVERLDVKASGCIYIGDGGHQEFTGAKEAGMTTVLTTYFIKNLWPEKIESLKQDADYIVDGIDEIANH